VKLIELLSLKVAICILNKERIKDLLLTLQGGIIFKKIQKEAELLFLWP